jgi:hypothetical protein
MNAGLKVPAGSKSWIGLGYSYLISPLHSFFLFFHIKMKNIVLFTDSLNWSKPSAALKKKFRAGVIVQCRALT